MLTVERLREVAIYNRQTGIFRWRISRPKIRVGEIAGTINDNGYIEIKIDGRAYKGHRLAWLYEYGEWPVGDLDHRDTVKTHNALDNLRPTDDKLNQGNRGPSCTNKLGLRGVSLVATTGRYRAVIHRVMNGGRRQVYLGSFPTPEEASAAYAMAAVEQFGEFARI